MSLNERIKDLQRQYDKFKKESSSKQSRNGYEISTNNGLNTPILGDYMDSVR